MKKTAIFDGDEIKAITAELRVLMPGLAEIADCMGHDLEAGARLMSLKTKCTEARERKGLSIKDVAQQLKVLQRQIKAIESGRLGDSDGAVLRRYVELLGLGKWVKRWVAANEELAVKLGLAAATPKSSTKKPVPEKRKKASSKKTTKATKVASDLDIDYEMYLESYAEDDDGGKRPRLSKERFARLSDEMMDLVNWENVDPLPLKEKRRMKELEYLLIA